MKIKLLHEFTDYLTDPLKEEMSKFYPKPEDVHTDYSTNDMVMNEHKFSHNFIQLFPQVGIFLNNFTVKRGRE